MKLFIRNDYLNVVVLFQGDNNPLTTMVINNMPYEYGQLYCQAIRAKLRDCLRGDEEFEFKVNFGYLYTPL